LYKITYNFNLPLDCALVKENRKIPPATVKRLPLYLQCLDQIDSDSIGISSKNLANLAKVNDAQVRRDLSYLGTLGTRGVGYDIKTLRNQLQLELGLVEGWSAVIVGVGNLGSALAHYGGFKDKGFGVVGLFDDDPKKINSQVAGLVVTPLNKMEEYCKKYNVAIGIIATPGEYAQGVADQLIDCGVRSILNFAPVLLKNVKDVQIRSVDLSQELQILSYYLDRPILKAVD
jgi:redox-sensing transcriptional repressor